MKTEVDWLKSHSTENLLFGTSSHLFQALNLALELEEKLNLSVKFYFSVQNHD